jgi:hypothetical protein
LSRSANNQATYSVLIAFINASNDIQLGNLDKLGTDLTRLQGLMLLDTTGYIDGLTSHKVGFL